MNKYARALSEAGTVALSHDSTDAKLTTASKGLLLRLKKAGDGAIVRLNLGPGELTARQLALVLREPLLWIVRRRPPKEKGSKTEGASLSYLVAVDPKCRNLWDLDAALRKMSHDEGETLVMVLRGCGAEPQLVGPVDEMVADTYRFVREAEEATTKVLVKTKWAATPREKLTSQAASNRLTRVSGLGLIHKIGHDASQGGRPHRVFVAVQ